MPAFPELKEPLRKGRAGLRFEAEQDIPEVLIAHQDDPAMHVRLGLERPPSGAELGRRIERGPDDRRLGEAVRFTILDGESDTCCGQLDIHHVEWEHRRAEGGLWVAPGKRNLGLGSGALQLAAHWLFSRCGLGRLELLTEPDNLPMLRAARRAGMVQEGILRGYVRERGRRLDVMVLSLLPSDIEAPHG
jgi:RimJ/RimL family protein N-acetyltransferase